MNSKLNLLLNIKPAEAKLVKQLFLVQFCLGIATAFLFTSSLALFLHTFDVKEIPKMYMAAAALLLGANVLYGKLEAKLPGKKLLQSIILFSAISILGTWAGLAFLKAPWLSFFLSAWNVVISMLVGYAFWGMAAILFNVRESKRLFSVVGSGDIPAKLLGYTSVSLLAPLFGVEHLLWFSIAGFVLAFYFLNRFDHHAVSGHGHQVDHGTGAGAVHHTHSATGKSFIDQYFQNKLIFYITLFSLVAFTVYSLLDYTLLAEVKSRFASTPDLAAFIGIFFAVGRIMALLIKLVLSSRVISRLGLVNSLLISPVILLAISALLLLLGESDQTIFYTFGIMVLLAEVLKSAVQEPAFFVLFQPLDPHSRLKGHLISKGYTMPFALFASGLFLILYTHFYGGVPIATVSQILITLLIGWIISVFLIKKEYLIALVDALKKGYFTGSELFLNDEPVRNLLIKRLESHKPKEVILALGLLEKSGYRNMEKRLLPLLDHPSEQVVKFVLYRVVALKLTNALPHIENKLGNFSAKTNRPDFIQAFYYLAPQVLPAPMAESLNVQLAAFVGLSLRIEQEAHDVVFTALVALSRSTKIEEKLAVLDLLLKAPQKQYNPVLEYLLQDPAPAVHKKAIEVTGKLKEPSLISLALQTASSRKAYNALQNALVHYGDAIYSLNGTHFVSASPELKLPIIKAAGQIKGEYSTLYLVEELENEFTFHDAIIEALWAKGALLEEAGKALLEEWFKGKLKQSKLKLQYCNCLEGQNQIPLLLTALSSELKQDVQKMLKSLALLYAKNRIGRVMELLALGEPEKIANGIEMLEQLIPKKYFLQLEILLDFHVNHQKDHLPLQEKYLLDGSTIVTEILSDNPAGCSSWVQAVACYSILDEPDPEYRKALLGKKDTSTDPLLAETKGYVLSKLNQPAQCY